MKKEDFKITFKKSEELFTDYTQVPNTLWTTKQLSLEDKVVLGYLLSHKNNFKANKTFLATGLKVSRKFFIDSLKRLEKSKVLSVTESNTLTFNLSVLSVTQSDTIVLPKVTDSNNEVLPKVTHQCVTESDTLDEVLPKVTDSVTESDTIVLPKVTDSVTESNTNNTIDNKNKQKEEQKDKHSNNDLVSEVLLSVTLGNVDEVLPKVTLPKDDSISSDNFKDNSSNLEYELTPEVISIYLGVKNNKKLFNLYLSQSKELKFQLPTYYQFEKAFLITLGNVLHKRTNQNTLTRELFIKELNTNYDNVIKEVLPISDVVIDMIKSKEDMITKQLQFLKL